MKLHILRHISCCTLFMLLLVACQEESHPFVPDDVEEVAICMNAHFVEDEEKEPSRALVTDDAGLQKVPLGVYATKKVGSNTEVVVFDNVELKYNATNGWDYSPKKYWDRTANYDFAAYAPYSVSARTSYASSTNTLTISSIPYWQQIDGNEIDYLVAHSNGSADDYLNNANATSTAVGFNFSHLLSQLVVNIVKEDSLANPDVIYKIKRVAYIHVPKDNNSFTYTYELGRGTMSEISLHEGELEILTDDNEGKLVTVLNATSGKITLSHLVVPFSLTDSKKVQIKITYTIEGTERTKTVDTPITALEAGKYNELSLTFKGTDIVPNLSIQNWKDAQPIDEDKYNW